MTSSDIKVKPVRYSDIPDLRKLEHQLFSEHPFSHPLLPEDIGRLFWDPCWRCVTARRQASGKEQIVGYRIFSLRNEKWEGQAFGESVAVVPACRRSGVASALFSESHEIARAEGSERFYSHVHPANTASLAAMLKAGYEIGGTTQTGHGPRFVMSFDLSGFRQP